MANQSLISNKILHSPYLPISLSPHLPTLPTLSLFPDPLFPVP
ncbi:hypothetical protein [Moorena producens]|nr:hypothetical protein [Moorena producens]